MIGVCSVKFLCMPSFYGSESDRINSDPASAKRDSKGFNETL